jgi:hypothetical protein
VDKVRFNTLSGSTYPVYVIRVCFYITLATANRDSIFLKTPFPTMRAPRHKHPTALSTTLHFPRSHCNFLVVTMYRYSCSHLATATNIPISTILSSRERPVCADCGCPGPNLWICLFKNCLQIGCGEKSNDHSTVHNLVCILRFNDERANALSSII